ncbi:universal stress protein [Prescottella agglutinans]|uniref:universal stress protein n=1 Tax=Prescottella agglutinans TaxID=1644129 RepID=UPI001F4D39CC|nr:universal stress protein [Prescottella agglutinans]
MDTVETKAPVVVGIDGSASSFAAVNWAAREARLHGCPIHLVAALGAPTPYGDGIRLPPSYFADRDRAVHGHLDRAAAIARTVESATPVTEITSEILTGPARPALIEESKSARMVVVGSRGLGQVTAALAGSVAVALTAHAHCPVVVIREPAERVAGVGEVVVGIDGTENSRPALAVGLEEASLRGVGLVAMHTWSPFTLSTVFDDQLDLPWDEVEVAEQAVLAESLAGWAERYPQTPVARVVVRGNSAEQLRQRAADAVLLVVGTHGRGGFAGMLIGSTSTVLLHSATCPLMIVRS